MNPICSNIDIVKKRIESACIKAGRPVNDVKLISVSKTKPLDDIKEAHNCGELHFGENRAKELQEKMENYSPDDIQWHMIGAIQTKKIKYIAGRVNWIDSVSKEKTLKEIEKRAAEAGRTINTLIQVNISNESQKSGCEPDYLPRLLDYARPLKNTRVCGLMGIATLTKSEDVIRDEFKLLKELFERFKGINDGAVQLTELSMGMTNDMEIAIEEGSTMVRVGRAIFGERNYN